MSRNLVIVAAPSVGGGSALVAICVGLGMPVHAAAGLRRAGRSNAGRRVDLGCQDSAGRAGALLGEIRAGRWGVR